MTDYLVSSKQYYLFVIYLQEYAKELPHSQGVSFAFCNTGFHKNQTTTLDRIIFTFNHIQCK